MTNKSRKEGVYLVEQKTKLQEMLEKKEKIKLGGGTKKIEKQRSSGKLTARERIDTTRKGQHHGHARIPHHHLRLDMR